MLIIIVAGAHPRRMAAELPHITGQYWHFEMLAEVRSYFSLTLQTLNRLLNVTLTWVAIPFVLFCAMVSSNQRARTMS